MFSPRGGKSQISVPQRVTHKNKEIRDIIEALTKQGWTTKKNAGKHWKLVTPDGRISIPISTTTCNPCAPDMIIRDIRRYAGFDVRPFL